MVYYIVALGIESFFFIACTLCYLKHVNMLMALVEKSPFMCSSLEHKHVDLKIFNLAVLGPFLFCILHFRMTLNICSEFVRFTLFHFYIPHLVDMTYFVISVLSF